MNAWACPTCRARVPGGEAPCHCSACHQTFHGLAAFDRHRRGLACCEPARVEPSRNGSRFHLDGRGVWRWGRVRTPDDYEAARARRAERMVWTVRA
ncbi:FDXHR family putative zinc-binding protein [Actinomyces culturomici]